MSTRHVWVVEMKVNGSRSFVPMEAFVLIRSAQQACRLSRQVNTIAEFRITKYEATR